MKHRPGTSNSFSACPGRLCCRPATVSKQVKTIVLGDLPVFFTVVSVASKLFWAQTALNACHSRSRALLAA